MEERLRYILSATNEWLRFAETKNAALLVFAGALALGALQRINDQVAAHVRYVAAAGLTLLAATAFCALALFVPKLKPENLKAPGRPADTDDLLFYGHAAKYDPRQYLECLAKLCPPAVAGPALSDHYAHQIVINARIALKKYAWFKRGVSIGIAAIVTLACAGILQLIAMRQ